MILIIRFDLVTICPPYVLGPIIHEASSPETLNTCESPPRQRELTAAVANWYAYLKGEKSAEDAIAPAGILCDVRDVARAHVTALGLPEAAGKRFGVATRESLRKVRRSELIDRYIHTASTLGSHPRVCRPRSLPQRDQGRTREGGAAPELVRLLALAQDPGNGADT